MAFGEDDGDRRTGMAAIGCHLVDAERIQRLGRGVGEVFEGRPRLRQLVREAEAGQIEAAHAIAGGEGEAGELLAEHRHQRAHRFRGNRAGMEHRERRTAACAQVMHAPLANRHEVLGDLHQ